MKKLLSILLAIVMMFGVIQTSALALNDTTVATLTTVDGEVIEYDDVQLCFADTPRYLGCTIVLHKDVTLPDGERLHNSFNDYVNYTVDFNGFTITGNHSDLLSLGSSQNHCDVVFKDSVGTGGITNLYEDEGSVISSVSNVIFEGGNYKSINGFVYYTGATDNYTPITAQTIINGGTFETSGTYALELMSSHVIINGGVFKGRVNYTEFDFANCASSGIVYGGEFFNGLTANGYLNDLIADGYGAFDENGNERIFTELTRSTKEYCLVKESTNPEREYVAKVIYKNGNEQSFIDFWEAYGRARGNKDSTLVLLSDVNLDKPLNTEKYQDDKTIKRFTIDLNGHIIQETEQFVKDTRFSGILVVDAYTTLTIKDTTEKGKIICNGYNNASIAVTNYGNLTLENVTLENNGEYSSKDSGLLNEYNGTVVIKNATITDNTANGYAIYNRNYCYIYDGVFTGYYSLLDFNGDFKLYGGEYNGWFRQMSAMYCLAEGYYFYENGEPVLMYEEPYGSFNSKKFTVKNLYPVSVTDANGSTKYYGSLDFVYGDGSSGSLKDCLIKLLAVLVEGGDLPLNFKTTIDLNGKTLNAENGLTVAENGDLVITDSVGNGQINGGITVDGGTLDVQAGTINGTANGVANESGNVTISGGEINGANGYSDIVVSGDNVTVIKGGSYPDGFSIAGSTINNALDSEYVFYNDNGQVAVGDNQMTISGNVVVYEKTLIHAMSTQIRFDLNADKSFAGTVDIRTRAKISDADFKKYIADTNDEAEQKISAAGFVYSTIDKTFDMSVAQSVAKGEAVEGYTNAPVTYIQDCDGYYMFACTINNIPQADIVQGIHAYAYICVNGIWYFFPAPSVARFNELYDKYYPMAAEEYGWTTEAE